MPAPAASRRTTTRRTASAPAWGLAAALTLMALAMAVPAVTGWDVHVRWFPPLHADWAPRVGPGTAPAVLLALAAVAAGGGAVRWTERLSWRWLLAGAFLVGLAWMLALAFVDGKDGVGVILQTQYEYLRTARSTTDLGATLHEYVSRIRYDAAPRNWPVHIAGHPPGALLFFVGLVRVGLGGGFAAGLVVTVLAATTPLAVLTTLRSLGAERPARRAAPFLVLGPAAVWQSVSADALFAAVGAWGIAALAMAATRRSAPWAVLAGLLLGYAVMMSYGLPLLGLLAVAVLWCAGTWRPLLPAALAALAVVGAFALAGFHYWEALPALHDRYWGGVASRRPAGYWMWGNLAALLFSAGPLAGAALAQQVHVAREAARRPGLRAAVGVPRAADLAGPAPARPAEVSTWTLAAAGWAMVLLADLSQMSRAEVERIWLPFVPWILLGCALLPARWRRGGLMVQLVAALAVQHLLATGW